MRFDFRDSGELLRSLARDWIVRACPAVAPIEPPKPMPVAQSDTTTLHVTTTEVLVPTLVEKRGGGILYGLKQGDFVLEDNGVPQKIRVQEEMDSAPVALVVAVEQGGVSVLEFEQTRQARSAA